MSNELTQQPQRAAIAEVIERDLQVSSLPHALALLSGELATLARRMQPDDISFDFDMPAGTMHFRAYRRSNRD